MSVDAVIGTVKTMLAGVGMIGALLVVLVMAPPPRIVDVNSISSANTEPIHANLRGKPRARLLGKVKKALLTVGLFTLRSDSSAARLYHRFSV